MYGVNLFDKSYYTSLTTISSSDRDMWNKPDYVRSLQLRNMRMVDYLGTPEAEGMGLNNHAA